MNWSEVKTGLILIRHGEVSDESRQLCYGQTDVPLSENGHQQSLELARCLSSLPLKRAYHSGLSRAARVTQLLSDFPNCEIVCDENLQERNFGAWESQSWDSIFKTHGEEMMKMISEPDSYRAGGGETTFEHRDRVLHWYEQLDWTGCTAAVTHGGVIAALLGTIFQKPVSEWLEMIPPYGSLVYIPDRNGLGLRSSLEFRGLPGSFST